MRLAEDALACRQGSAEEGLCLSEVVLGLVKDGKVVDAGESARVVVAEDRPAGGQNAAVKRLGVAVMALGLVEACEVVDAG
jgi:hypothetical protein